MSKSDPCFDCNGVLMNIKTRKVHGCKECLRNPNFKLKNGERVRVP